MSADRPIIVGAALGAFWGCVSARLLFVGSWASLVPWALTGLAIGAFSATRRDALAAGIAYGVSLPVAFMLSGYDGAWTAAKIGPLLLFCAVLAVIGLGCGAALAMLGRLARRLRGPTSPEKKKPA